MYICCTIFLLININKQLVAIVLVLLAYRYVCTYVHIIFIVYTYFPTFAFAVEVFNRFARKLENIN